uniref:Uncharacterized protein n=1 Tax=Neovison vison TaxID=452646 RepID=A0A8C7BCM1_NEOVI
MNKNIDVLEKVVRITVTPEDGIYAWVFTRETIYPYLEDIPDPEVNWIPCIRFGYTPVQQSLNCLAKDNSIYIVANTGAGSPTVPVTLSVLMVVVTNTTTDVVFDSEGGLVARYCKSHEIQPPCCEYP